MILLSGFKNENKAKVWHYLQKQIKIWKDGERIICKGIDPILVENLKTQNNTFLDNIAPKNPVLLVSQSMHPY